MSRGWLGMETAGAGAILWIEALGRSAREYEDRTEAGGRVRIIESEHREVVEHLADELSVPRSWIVWAGNIYRLRIMGSALKGREDKRQ